MSVSTRLLQLLAPRTSEGVQTPQVDRTSSQPPLSVSIKINTSEHPLAESEVPGTAGTLRSRLASILNTPRHSQTAVVAAAEPKTLAGLSGATPPNGPPKSTTESRIVSAMERTGILHKGRVSQRKGRVQPTQSEAVGEVTCHFAEKLKRELASVYFLSLASQWLAAHTSPPGSNQQQPSARNEAAAHHLRVLQHFVYLFHVAVKDPSSRNTKRRSTTTNAVAMSDEEPRSREDSGEGNVPDIQTVVSACLLELAADPANDDHRALPPLSPHTLTSLASSDTPRGGASNNQFNSSGSAAQRMNELDSLLLPNQGLPPAHAFEAAHPRRESSSSIGEAGVQQFIPSSPGFFLQPQVSDGYPVDSARRRSTGSSLQPPSPSSPSRVRARTVAVTSPTTNALSPPGLNNSSVPLSSSGNNFSTMFSGRKTSLGSSQPVGQNYSFSSASSVFCPRAVMSCSTSIAGGSTPRLYYARLPPSRRVSSESGSLVGNSFAFRSSGTSLLSLQQQIRRYSHPREGGVNSSQDISSGFSGRTSFSQILSMNSEEGLDTSWAFNATTPKNNPASAAHPSTISVCDATVMQPSRGEVTYFKDVAGYVDSEMDKLVRKLEVAAATFAEQVLTGKREELSSNRLQIESVVQARIDHCTRSALRKVLHALLTLRAVPDVVAKYVPALAPESHPDSPPRSPVFGMKSKPVAPLSRSRNSSQPKTISLHPVAAILQRVCEKAHVDLEEAILRPPPPPTPTTLSTFARKNGSSHRVSDSTSGSGSPRSNRKPSIEFTGEIVFDSGRYAGPQPGSVAPLPPAPGMATRQQTAPPTARSNDARRPSAQSNGSSVAVRTLTNTHCEDSEEQPSLTNPMSHRYRRPTVSGAYVASSDEDNHKSDDLPPLPSRGTEATNPQGESISSTSKSMSAVPSIVFPHIYETSRSPPNMPQVSTPTLPTSPEGGVLLGPSLNKNSLPPRSESSFSPASFTEYIPSAFSVATMADSSSRALGGSPGSSQQWGSDSLLAKMYAGMSMVSSANATASHSSLGLVAASLLPPAHTSASAAPLPEANLNQTPASSLEHPPAMSTTTPFTRPSSSAVGGATLQQSSTSSSLPAPKMWTPKTLYGRSSMASGSMTTQTSHMVPSTTTNSNSSAADVSAMAGKVSNILDFSGVVNSQEILRHQLMQQSRMSSGAYPVGNDLSSGEVESQSLHLFSGDLLSVTPKSDVGSTPRAVSPTLVAHVDPVSDNVVAPCSSPPSTNTQRLNELFATAKSSAGSMSTATHTQAASSMSPLNHAQPYIITNSPSNLYFGQGSISSSTHSKNLVALLSNSEVLDSRLSSNQHYHYHSVSDQQKSVSANIRSFPMVSESTASGSETPRGEGALTSHSRFGNHHGSTTESSELPTEEGSSGLVPINLPSSAKLGKSNGLTGATAWEATVSSFVDGGSDLVSMTTLKSLSSLTRPHHATVLSRIGIPLPGVADPWQSPDVSQEAPLTAVPVSLVSVSPGSVSPSRSPSHVPRTPTTNSSFTSEVLRRMLVKGPGVVTSPQSPPSEAVSPMTTLTANDARPVPGGSEDSDSRRRSSSEGAAVAGTNAGGVTALSSNPAVAALLPRVNGVATSDLSRLSSVSDERHEKIVSSVSTGDRSNASGSSKGDVGPHRSDDVEGGSNGAPAKKISISVGDLAPEAAPHQPSPTSGLGGSSWSSGHVTSLDSVNGKPVQLYRFPVLHNNNGSGSRSSSRSSEGAPGGERRGGTIAPEKRKSVGPKSFVSSGSGKSVRQVSSSRSIAAGEPLIAFDATGINNLISSQNSSTGHPLMGPGMYSLFASGMNSMQANDSTASLITKAGMLIELFVASSTTPPPSVVGMAPSVQSVSNPHRRSSGTAGTSMNPTHSTATTNSGHNKTLFSTNLSSHPTSPAGVNNGSNKSSRGSSFLHASNTVHHQNITAEEVSAATGYPVQEVREALGVTSKAHMQCIHKIKGGGPQQHSLMASSSSKRPADPPTAAMTVLREAMDPLMWSIPTPVPTDSETEWSTYQLLVPQPPAGPRAYLPGEAAATASESSIVQQQHGNGGGGAVPFILLPTDYYNRSMGSFFGGDKVDGDDSKGPAASEGDTELDSSSNRIKSRVLSNTKASPHPQLRVDEDGATSGDDSSAWGEGISCPTAVLQLLEGRSEVNNGRSLTSVGSQPVAFQAASMSTSHSEAGQGSTVSNSLRYAAGGGGPATVAETHKPEGSLTSNPAITCTPPSHPLVPSPPMQVSSRSSTPTTSASFKVQATSAGGTTSRPPSGSRLNRAAFGGGSSNSLQQARHTGKRASLKDSGEWSGRSGKPPPSSVATSTPTNTLLGGPTMNHSFGSHHNGSFPRPMNLDGIHASTALTPSEISDSSFIHMHDQDTAQQPIVSSPGGHLRANVPRRSNTGSEDTGAALTVTLSSTAEEFAEAASQQGSSLNTHPTSLLPTDLPPKSPARGATHTPTLRQQRLTNTAQNSSSSSGTGVGMGVGVSPNTTMSQSLGDEVTPDNHATTTTNQDTPTPTPPSSHQNVSSVPAETSVDSGLPDSYQITHHTWSGMDDTTFSTSNPLESPDAVTLAVTQRERDSRRRLLQLMAPLASALAKGRSPLVASFSDPHSSTSNSHNTSSTSPLFTRQVTSSGATRGGRNSRVPPPLTSFAATSSQSSDSGPLGPVVPVSGVSRSCSHSVTELSPTAEPPISMSSGENSTNPTAPISYSMAFLHSSFARGGSWLESSESSALTNTRNSQTATLLFDQSGADRHPSTIPPLPTALATLRGAGAANGSSGIDSSPRSDATHLRSSDSMAPYSARSSYAHSGAVHPVTSGDVHAILSQARYIGSSPTVGTSSVSGGDHSVTALTTANWMVGGSSTTSFPTNAMSSVSESANPQSPAMKKASSLDDDVRHLTVTTSSSSPTTLLNAEHHHRRRGSSVFHPHPKRCSHLTISDSGNSSLSYLDPDGKGHFDTSTSDGLVRSSTPQRQPSNAVAANTGTPTSPLHNSRRRTSSITIRSAVTESSSEKLTSARHASSSGNVWSTDHRDSGSNGSKTPYSSQPKSPDCSKSMFLTTPRTASDPPSDAHWNASVNTGLWVSESSLNNSSALTGGSLLVQPPHHYLPVINRRATEESGGGARQLVSVPSMTDEFGDMGQSSKSTHPKFDSSRRSTGFADISPNSPAETARGSSTTSFVRRGSDNATQTHTRDRQKPLIRATLFTEVAASSMFQNNPSASSSPLHREATTSSSLELTHSSTGKTNASSSPPRLLMHTTSIDQLRALLGAANRDSSPSSVLGGSAPDTADQPPFHYPETTQLSPAERLRQLLSVATPSSPPMLPPTPPVASLPSARLTQLLSASVVVEGADASPLGNAAPLRKQHTNQHLLSIQDVALDAFSDTSRSRDEETTAAQKQPLFNADESGLSSFGSVTNSSYHLKPIGTIVPPATSVPVTPLQGPTAEIPASVEPLDPSTTTECPESSSMPSVVVVTRGSKGASAITPKSAVTAPSLTSFPNVDVNSSYSVAGSGDAAASRMATSVVRTKSTNFSRVGSTALPPPPINVAAVRKLREVISRMRIENYFEPGEPEEVVATAGDVVNLPFMESVGDMTSNHSHSPSITPTPSHDGQEQPPHRGPSHMGTSVTSPSQIDEHLSGATSSSKFAFSSAPASPSVQKMSSGTMSTNRSGSSSEKLATNSPETTRPQAKTRKRKPWSSLNLRFSMPGDVCLDLQASVAAWNQALRKPTLTLPRSPIQNRSFSEASPDRGGGGCVSSPDGTPHKQSCEAPKAPPVPLSPEQLANSGSGNKRMDSSMTTSLPNSEVGDREVTAAYHDRPVSGDPEVSSGLWKDGMPHSSHNSGAGDTSVRHFHSPTTLPPLSRKFGSVDRGQGPSAANGAASTTNTTSSLLGADSVSQASQSQTGSQLPASKRDQDGGGTSPDTPAENASATSFPSINISPPFKQHFLPAAVGGGPSHSSHVAGVATTLQTSPASATSSPSRPVSRVQSPVDLGGESSGNIRAPAGGGRLRTKAHPDYHLYDWSVLDLIPNGVRRRVTKSDFPEYKALALKKLDELEALASRQNVVGVPHSTSPRHSMSSFGVGAVHSMPPTLGESSSSRGALTGPAAPPSSQGNSISTLKSMFPTDDTNNQSIGTPPKSFLRRLDPAD